MASKKRRQDRRKRIGVVRGKLSEWKAKADKAARELRRFKRADLVRKAQRKARAAATKLKELRREERRLTRTIANADARKRKTTPKDARQPGRWTYHPKVSYLPRNHEATVEVSFHRRDYARMSTEEVQSALHDLVKQRERADLVIDTVKYGQLDADRTGKRRDLASFLGVVLSGNLETIGEEELK